MQYKDFEVTILPPREGEFPVRVRSPAGDDQGTFSLPFDEEGLADLSPESLGGRLFEALFSGQVRSLFDASLGMIRDRPDVGLRIKLCIDPEESPELARLAGLPWEYLYRRDTREFLSLSMHTPVVRYLEVPRPAEPLPLEKPLRILFVLASPRDQPPLRVEEEKGGISRALEQQRRAGQVEFEFVEGPDTATRLRRKLEEQAWHVVHFMGHGDFDPHSGKGQLCFEDQEGNTAPFSADKLMILLRDYPTVRLVFLNACRTAAMAGGGEQHDAFMGVASALVLGGVTAVIAMQFPISDQAARTFSEELYTQLARSRPVDEAVSRARQAVQIGLEGQEWGTPVLLMRSSDGRIFEPSPGSRQPDLSWVQATLPERDAVGVSRWLRAIQIRFDREMRPGEVSLSSSGPWFGLRRARVRYDTATRTFTFTRDNFLKPLPANTRIDFTMNEPGWGGNFQDRQGNVAPQDHFGFTTGTTLFSRRAALGIGLGLVLILAMVVIGLLAFRPRPSAYMELVLDNSNVAGQDGLSQIKDALRRELERSLPNSALALRIFGNECGQTQRLVDFRRGNAGQVAAALLGVRLVDHADLTEAIRQALDDVLRPGGRQPRAVVVITWGIEGCGSDLQAALKSYRQQLGSAVNLYLIGLGKASVEVDLPGVQSKLYERGEIEVELKRILAALEGGQMPGLLPTPARTPRLSPTPTHTPSVKPSPSPTP